MLQALQWINDFTAIPLDGHSKNNVTPYMHIMACHIPDQMRRHHGIKKFSGQGKKYITMVGNTYYYTPGIDRSGKK